MEKYLATGYHNQLKMQIQHRGKSMREFVTTVKQMAQCSYPAIAKGHLWTGAGTVFLGSVTDQTRKYSYFWETRKHATGTL
jgi:hypothetical protein